MKHVAVAVLLTASLIANAPTCAADNPSGASQMSLLATGSVLLAVSAIPLVPLQTISNARVAAVKPATNKTTDIEVRPNDEMKSLVIRVPDQALREPLPEPGQKADLVADKNGHTLLVENRPVAFIPGAQAEGLIHTREIK